MKPQTRSLFPFLTLLATLACPVYGHAETEVAIPVAAPVAAPIAKLGMVDLEQLLTQSEPGKKALAPLNELMKSMQGEADRMQVDIRKLRDQAIALTKNPGATGKERALTTLQHKYNEAVSDLKRFEREANQKIDQQRFTSLSEFNRLALPLIRSLGKEQGYTMIFRKQESGLLYADESTELTPQILERLNSGAATGQ